MKTLHIIFGDGSNPYVRFNMDKKQFRNELRKWKRNYNIVHKYQNGTIFNITLEEKPLTEIYERQFKERLRYQRMKRRARNTAMVWQEQFAEKAMSYEELAEAQSYFEKLGKRYGLLAEFRENGIC